MPVSESFRTFALDQLGRVTPGGVRGKTMFGGVGIYAGDRFFALLADDTLYLKADSRTRAEFVAAGMAPFKPFGDGAYEMSYYGVSAELLEDVDALRAWVGKALEAAQRTGRRRTEKKR